MARAHRCRLGPVSSARRHVERRGKLRASGKSAKARAGSAESSAGRTMPPGRRPDAGHCSRSSTVCVRCWNRSRLWCGAGRGVPDREIVQQELELGAPPIELAELGSQVIEEFADRVSLRGGRRHEGRAAIRRGGGRGDGVLGMHVAPWIARMARQHRSPFRYGVTKERSRPAQDRHRDRGDGVDRDPAAEVVPGGHAPPPVPGNGKVVTAEASHGRVDGPIPPMTKCVRTFERA
jgi:hypothetical protein